MKQPILLKALRWSAVYEMPIFTASPDYCIITLPTEPDKSPHRYKLMHQTTLLLKALRWSAKNLCSVNMSIFRI